MENLNVVESMCLRSGTAEDDLVRETGGPMFLVEVLALGSLLYRNCLALKVRIEDYWTLLHVAYILEVDVAAFIWEQVDLIGLIDAITIRLVIIEGLMAIMSAETLSADEVSAISHGKV